MARNQKLLFLVHLRYTDNTRIGSLVRVRVTRLNKARHSSRISIISEWIGLLNSIDLVPLDLDHQHLLSSELVQNGLHR
jgi:hypothetical protein